MMSSPLWGWAVAGGQELRAPAPTRGRCGVEAREFPRVGVRAFGPGELSGDPQPTGRPPLPPPGPLWLRAHATTHRGLRGPMFLRKHSRPVLSGLRTWEEVQVSRHLVARLCCSCCSPVFIALPGFL